MRTLPGMHHKFQPKEVRVVGSDGKQQGILPLGEAFRRADREQLDLVCVAPNSNPPVCKIMDFGKFKYEKKKADKANKKKAAKVQLKSVKFRPKIGEHDLKVKINKVSSFLESGNRVKLIMTFKGRENIYKEIGVEILERVLDSVEEFGKEEGPIQLEGRALTALVVPLK